MISRRESKKRFSGIKRICRNEKGSIVFRDGVEYDTAFLHKARQFRLLTGFDIGKILLFTRKTVCEICDNTLLRHNRGNQLVIGDIECGVIDLYTVCGHALFVPHIGDFSGGALFDVDVCTCWGVHIDGGGGGADVEGDTVVFGEDGDT